MGFLFSLTKAEAKNVDPVSSFLAPNTNRVKPLNISLFESMESGGCMIAHPLAVEVGTVPCKNKCIGG